MSKDYAKKFPPKTKKTKSNRFVKFIVILSILAILVLGFRFWQLQQHRDIVLPNQKIKPPTKITQQKTTQDPTQETKIHFEFYNMLSKNKLNAVQQDLIDKPVMPISTNTDKMTAKPTENEPLLETKVENSATEKYVLQLGVFSNRDTALISKNQMANLGVPIQVVQDETNGKTIYRVQAGPFTTLEATNQLQANLEKSKVKSLVRKVS